MFTRIIKILSFVEILIWLITMFFDSLTSEQLTAVIALIAWFIVFELIDIFKVESLADEVKFLSLDLKTIKQQNYTKSELISYELNSLKREVDFLNRIHNEALIIIRKWDSMKITLSILSDEAIEEIKNLGGEFRLAQHSDDLTNIAYNIVFSNGKSVGIGKAVLFLGNKVIEITQGAIDNLWDLMVEGEEKITGNLTEEELLLKLKEVASE